MSGAEIEAAKRETKRARQRLDSSMVALQQRLQPKALASEAWGGVKDKSSELADTALETVRERPVAVSAALAGVVLFLARNPLRRAAGRILSGKKKDDEDGRVTVRVSTDNANYNPAAPLVDAPLKEGAIR